MVGSAALPLHEHELRAQLQVVRGQGHLGVNGENTEHRVPLDVQSLNLVFQLCQLLTQHRCYQGVTHRIRVGPVGREGNRAIPLDPDTDCTEQTKGLDEIRPGLAYR